MRLHELVTDRGRVVAHDVYGHCLVLTPEGAVFNNEDTDDLLNMSVACGVLLDDCWRDATDAEIEALRTTPQDMMMHLVWASPSPRPSARERFDRAGLRVVSAT